MGGDGVKKSELIERLQVSRQEMERLLRGLSEEQMIEPGAMDDWSIKDILAHLCRWEGETVTMLFELKQGQKLSRTRIKNMEDVDRVNAEWHEEDRDRPLDLVLGDFRGLRKQTLRRVEEYSEQELNDPDLHPSLRGEPLYTWIAVDTYEHEAEHAEHIREWRQEKGI